MIKKTSIVYLNCGVKEENRRENASEIISSTVCVFFEGGRTLLVDFWVDFEVELKCEKEKVN